VRPLLLWKGHKCYAFWVCVYGLSGCTMFSTLSHERHDFRKNIIGHKIFILIFSTSFVSNISHCKKNWVRYYYYYYYCYIPRPSFHILNKLKFSRQVFEKYSYQISWKSVQWESSCSIRTDGRTGRQAGRQRDRPTMLKLIFTFRNFVKAPKNGSESV